MSFFQKIRIFCLQYMILVTLKMLFLRINLGELQNLVKWIWSRESFQNISEKAEGNCLIKSSKSSSMDRVLE